jgi:DHA1 family bicyclomycin/chloramphenicol resistance-like MFS transporter
MHQSLFRTALVLGLLSVIGPFSIDMYLPAMPQIGEDLGAPETQVQMTITLYFLAFGLAQFIWGRSPTPTAASCRLILGISLSRGSSCLRLRAHVRMADRRALRPGHRGAAWAWCRAPSSATASRRRGHAPHGHGHAGHSISPMLAPLIGS